MAIKAIQLRGISRTPSDRMTADGGLAESLNVFLDEDETAPMPMPEDVTETATDGDGKKLFPSTDVEGNPTDWEAVFIHKSPYFTRAIVKYTEEEESEEPAQPSSGTSGYEVDEEQDPWEVDDSENWGDSNEPVESGGSQSQEESGESATGTTASTVAVTKLGWVNDGSVVDLMTIDPEETFVRCVGLGNTIGIITDKTVHWFLCKYGEYSELGSDIPFPRFTLAPKIVASNSETSSFSIASSSFAYTDYGGSPTAVIKRNYPIKSNYDISDSATISEINDRLNSIVSNNSNSGQFCYPRFAILSIETLDGKYISSPILLRKELSFVLKYHYRSQFTMSGTYNPVSGETHNHLVGDVNESIEVTNGDTYKLFVQILEDSDFFDKWKDVVKYIRVYLSTGVYGYQVNRCKILNATVQDNLPSFDDMGNQGSIEAESSIMLLWDIGMEEELLSRAQFFLAASYDLDDKEKKYKELFDGVVLDLSSTHTTSDTPVSVMTDTLLQVQEPLDFSKADMKRYSTYFRQAIPYNNQLVASQISERVKFSYPCLTATAHESTEPTYYVKGITFHCVDSGGKWFAVEADINGYYERPSGTDYASKIKVNIDGDSKWPVPYGFIICPDVRAKYADISVYKEVDSGVAFNTVIRVEMTEHPFLDCSYWYGDIGKQIVEFGTSSATRAKYPLAPEPVEIDGGDVYVFDVYHRGAKSFTDVVSNKVYVSEMDSPFTFPLAKRHTFTGKVIGCAIASTALSTGQFGQYPLYVFTDDGIWAMETGAAGDFVTSKPVSRDVCINPESITSIDNAVVFVTEKGVMVISGSQIQCISENMNGQHFHLDRSSEEYNLIAGSDWASLLDDITTDDTHFMAFMKEAFITYDYTGARLVFFKPDEKYQYAYYLKTATWHKTYVDCGLADTESDGLPRFEYPLSDYPETYVNALCESEQNPGYRILKMSTRKDVAATGRVRGMIVTRPIEFGLADVRKVIKDIRIRGVYEKSEGKGAFYILLGSYDGLHWSVLRSLRGGSYKLFRMIILTNLAPNERISWIDADFEERYNNKLR